LLEAGEKGGQRTTSRWERGRNAPKAFEVNDDEALVDEFACRYRRGGHDLATEKLPHDGHGFQMTLGRYVLVQLRRVNCSNILDIQRTALL